MQIKIVIFLCLLTFFLGAQDKSSSNDDLDLDIKKAEKKKEKKEEDKKEKKKEKKKDDEIYDLGGTVVKKDKKTSAESSSNYKIDIGNLKIIPRKNAAEQLMLAPGVLIVNHGGTGHAHSTYMRGFAAKEGQDIEFMVDGIPLNEISNPHGHGYTDLHFIMPELVKTVDIKEGPFDAYQGDFAFAGTADYKLGVIERGSTISTSYGLWNTSRTAMVIAPENQDEQTFAGFEFYKTDGYGSNRAAIRGSGTGRYSGGNDLFDWHLTAFGYMARYDQAGVIREDDYKDGEIGFYDTYDPDQGGKSNRILVSFDLFSGEKGRSEFNQTTYFGYRNMSLKANFTGFMNDVDEYGNKREDQRGDNTEMRYSVFTAGTKGLYSLTGTVLGKEQQLNVGYSVRFDHGDTEQIGLSSELGNPYKEIFSDTFNVGNIAGFAGYNIKLFSFLKITAGLRLDSFFFGVTKATRSESLVEDTTTYPDQSIQASGFALSPRVKVESELFKGFSIAGSYGHATRSADSISLSDNEAAPFARSHQAEAGITYKYGKRGDPFSLKIQSSYLFAKVSKDISFNPNLGRNVAESPSTRHAFLFGARFFFGNWFDSLTNISYTHGTWDTTVTDEHNAGDLIENVPVFILREDIGISGNLFNWHIGSVPVSGRIGTGFTYMPGIPLKYKEYGTPMYLLNLGGQIKLWYFSLGAEMRNLINRKYHSAEYNYASNFKNSSLIGSKLPEKHFIAGEPFFVNFSLTWHFEDMFWGKEKN